MTKVGEKTSIHGFFRFFSSAPPEGVDAAIDPVEGGGPMDLWRVGGETVQ